MKNRNRVTFLLLGLVLAALAWFPGSAAMADMSGQKEHRLFGGKSGDITFPHHLHQTALKDCSACHDTFPQEAGAVGAMKKEGTLEKKQVMNTVCLKCHRAMKKSGAETGPTNCKGCHVK